MRRSSPPGGVELRKFSDNYLEGVFGLYRTVFGEQAEERFRARWRWSQKDNLAPDNTPKWALLAGSRVVGFLATVPQPYWIDGHTVIAHTPCDYMVEPESRFHGITLMQAFFRQCEHCVTFDDMQATIGVTKWLGAHSVGRLERYAKLLDPRGLRSSGAWQRVPGPLAWAAACLLGAGDLLLAPPVQSKIVPVAGFDDRFDTFARRLRQHVPAMIARDTRFLRWRYGPDSPHASRWVGTAVTGDGEIAGYVVFHLGQGAGRTGRILDLQHLPDSGPGTAASLLGYAVSRLREEGAWVIHHHQLDSPLSVPSKLLRRYGFLERGGHEMLVRMGDPSLSAVGECPANWAVGFGDTEASHSTS